MGRSGPIVGVPRPGRDDLVATFGGISLRRKESVVLDDAPAGVYNTRTELLERLLRDACELCGSERGCEVHHVRKVADLAKKSKANQVPWVKLMITRSRKTLIVCRDCHVKIHGGRIDKPGLQQITGEPNAVKAARWGSGGGRRKRIRKDTSPAAYLTARPRDGPADADPRRRRLLGSLVGQTEANIRQALRLVDAMAPCVVMLDEVEKALAGVASAARRRQRRLGADVRHAAHLAQ